MHKIAKFHRYSTYALNMLKNRLFSKISTLWMKFHLLNWGVVYGRNILFFGKTYLVIHPEASVLIGDNCTFRSSFQSNSIGLKQNCFISAGRNARLEIGNDCGISGTIISAAENIVLGDRVVCGANVTICDNDRHNLNAELRFEGLNGGISPIKIEDDVWIGMNTIVLKGVTIGRGAVIGANSVVNKDIPPNTIAAGVPVKIIRELIC